MTGTILLFGPTASGKTDLAIELAKQINAEIISADSMQVYRQMDIGTAKPSPLQRKEIPHHLIDVVDPDGEWTVSHFIRLADEKIKEITSKGKKPLIVGGTGLYLNAFINGYTFPIAPKDETVRERLSALGADELFNKLAAVDADAANKINKNDKKRLIRALEVFEQTGIPISRLQSGKRKKGLLLFCLDVEREQLYTNINLRADRMIKDGLVDEVRGLLSKGYGRDLVSMQALGYKEAAGYLDGEFSLEDMTELIKKRTRNFARRQLTWFRRFEGASYINPSNEEVLRILCEKSGGTCPPAES